MIASRALKMVKFIERMLTRLVLVQVARPYLILALALLTIFPAAALVRHLEVKTGFSELLPDDTPSVVEMRRVSGRLSSMSLLAVTAESKDTALLKRFVDELVPKLRTLPPDLIANVEDGPREAEKFFEQNKHLYAGLDELRRAPRQDPVTLRLGGRARHGHAARRRGTRADHGSDGPWHVPKEPRPGESRHAGRRRILHR